MEKTKKTEKHVNRPLFAVIIAAAGQGRRFRESRGESGTSFDDKIGNKAFADLLGKPVWLHSVDKFAAHSNVKQIIIVVAADDLDWFQAKYSPQIAQFSLEISLPVVAGGAERADSIQNALKNVDDDIDFVAGHDAARPCVSAARINDVFSAAQQHGAALLANPVVATLKRAENGQITETVSRENLWEAQTPQVFRRKIVFEAYEKRDKTRSTDDSQLVELAGYPVFTVLSDKLNLKITTYADFFLAEQIISWQNAQNSRFFSKNNL